MDNKGLLLVMALIFIGVISIITVLTGEFDLEGMSQNLQGDYADSEMTKTQ
jgi:hypothetical protein